MPNTSFQWGEKSFAAPGGTLLIKNKFLKGI